MTNTPWQDLLRQYHTAKAAADVDLSTVSPETLPAHKARKGMAAELAEELKRRVAEQVAKSSFAIFLPDRLPANRTKRFSQVAPGVDGSIVTLDASQAYRELARTACSGALTYRTFSPQNVQDLSVAASELAQQLNVQPFFFPGASRVHATVDGEETLVDHVRRSIRETNEGRLNGAYLQREAVRQVLEDEDRDELLVVCLVTNVSDGEALELASHFGRGSYVVDELPARDRINDKTVVEIFEKAKQNLK